ncbi:MAG: hypothetical protein ITG05_13075 [Pseudomonas stutzeri]|nr:hypothetical protein [Stutzerimonas stutzeri]
MTDRKIIQLVSAGSPAVLVALCDDGSAWQRTLDSTEQPWRALPPIPSPGAERVSEARPGNMGQRWEAADDEHLRRLWGEHGKLCSEIAAIMARSEGAIVARLAHLKLFADRESAREADRARRAARNAVMPPA